MKKSTTKSGGSRRVTSRRDSKSVKHADIANTLSGIEHIDTECTRATGLIELLKSWLMDDSGYDEKTWPKLKKALNDERARVRARRLFNE